MTEPDVASSDATNVRTNIQREGGDYVINGRKWYVSGAGARACKLLIVMGKTDPGGADAYRQQSMIPVPTEKRQEERRVGKGCVSTCQSRGSTYHKKTKLYQTQIN